MNIMHKFILTLLVLSAASCAERDRSNPFDPGSDNRLPADFNALAGNDKVYLSWQTLDYEDIESIDILRSGTIINSSPLDKLTTSFIDTGAENGQTYDYSLSLSVVGYDGKIVSNPDKATPGPNYGWVITENQTNVTKLTPDFRDVLFNLNMGFLYVHSIDVTDDSNELWVYDSAYRILTSFSVYGEPLQDLASNAVGFAIDHTDNTYWVASDNSLGYVYHYTRQGSLLRSYSTGFEIAGIAAYPLVDGALVGSYTGEFAIVGEDGVTRVEGFNSAELVMTGEGVQATALAPIRVWDTGSNTLYTISPADLDNQQNWHKTELGSGASAIDVSPDGLSCWIADPNQDLLLEIDAQGNIVARVSGLDSPWEVSTSVNDNDAVYVAGYNTKLSRVLKGGRVDWERYFINPPAGVALQRATPSQ